MASQRNTSEELHDAIVAAHEDYLDSISMKKRLPREFLQGIVRGFGMAIGGTIVFATVAYLLGRFLLIPGVENWVNDIKEDFTPPWQQTIKR